MDLTKVKINNGFWKKRKDLNINSSFFEILNSFEKSIFGDAWRGAWAPQINFNRATTDDPRNHWKLSNCQKLIFNEIGFLTQFGWF